ncbi:MAG: glycosyltransferase family 2 protein [Prevotella sp.]|jgi:glycosyltransferase involved in cell wall biosynthesis
MKISLIVTTYNWPEALRLCLDSIRNQTRLPDEVIIADDGSKDSTRKLIEKEKATFPCPLYHSWIPDKGFRAAQSRNEAFRRFCTGDYIVFIDQDIILDPRFISDHERLAEKGCFVAGGRAKLLPGLTRELVNGERCHLGIFTKGLTRRANLLHALWLHPVTKYMYCWKPLYGRSANMAVWKEDLIRTNGFDEQLVGYGVEDIDLFNRLLNLGVRKKYAQFCAISYHLYHRRGKVVQHNREIAFTECDRTYCPRGLVALR